MRDKIFSDGAKRIHFIGVGGISMSGLAEIMHRKNFTVSGSDDIESETTRRLANLGIRVDIPNAAANISPDIGLIVYTAAVKPENAEMVAAKELAIPAMERAAFLGKILADYDPVCIAGSHGKTTTTSMLAEIALAAGLDPTVSIGGHMNMSGLNYRIGDSRCFLLESCEYSNSFHHWHPKIGIILNIDADHLDFFGTFDNLIEAFAKFAANIRPEGALIIRSGISGFEKICAAAKCEVITFGPSATNGSTGFYPRTVQFDGERPSFDAMDGEKFLARVKLSLPGEYNVLNALACFAAAACMGISPEVTAAALAGATGAKRRFEFKGTYRGANIIDDYAHHPTEITACLSAARRSTGGKIICVFQPHTFTRTRNLLHEFAESFGDADTVVLVPIYASREAFDPGISSQMLTDEMKKRGKDVIFAENFCAAGNILSSLLRPGDLLITMGAGDVYEIGDGLLR